MMSIGSFERRRFMGGWAAHPTGEKLRTLHCSQVGPGASVNDLPRLHSGLLAKLCPRPPSREN